MTEGTIISGKRSKLVRALKIGFFLALAAWAVTLLAFVFTSVTLERVGNALRPGGSPAAWLIGVSGDEARSKLLLATEFVANWIFYAGLVLVVNLIINVMRRNVPDSRG